MSGRFKRKRPQIVQSSDASETDEELPEDKAKPKSKATKSAAKEQEGPAAQPASSFTDEEVTELRSSLLSWYDKNHRVLPWRRTPHSRRATPAPAGSHESAHPAPELLDMQQFAYHVWVSEIMLQQTQVATVLPYFARWVSRWPTVAALAVANMEELRHAWAGLGYYRRAQYLLDGAKHVMNNLGGRFPETAAGLMGIPGVGPYTSAAIGSIAFNDQAAVVDGNVIRVLARLRALPGDPQRLMPTFNTLASQALDPDRPGDFNQAVMELGATVCRPKNPECGACPASHCCRAYAEWKAYSQTHGLPRDWPPYALPAAKAKASASAQAGSSSSKASPSAKQSAAKSMAARRKVEEKEEKVVEEEDGDEVGEIEDLPYVTRFPSKKEVKEKKQQSVAVCILEVLHPKQGSSHANGSQAQAEGGKAGAAALSPPPKKRQRSMLDYASQGAKGAKSASAAKSSQERGGAKGSSHSNGRAVSALLCGMDRRYLLAQRPEGSGLLAGLWEFPGMLLEAEQETSYKARKQYASALLQSLLGPGFQVPGLTAISSSTDEAESSSAAGQGQQPGGESAGLAHSSTSSSARVGGARLVNREDAGMYVHTFSHIRQTNYVEVVRVAVSDLESFEDALRAAQPDLKGSQAEQSVGKAHMGTASKTKKEGAKKAGKEDEQVAHLQERPRLQWLSEDEMLAACKGGRGIKAGGGNGVVGLSTGPRKIFALVSKVDKS